MEIKTKIKNHLDSINLDIKKTHDARFMDQKVTPEVLSIISDCVLQYVGEDTLKEFRTKDIWEFNYSNENVKDIFNKPDAMSEYAKSEYDKFFQQPLKMLAYAQILSCEKRGTSNYFKINNIELLRFISFKEKNSLLFLNMYLEKVLKDSQIWSIFETFFNQNTKEKFNELKKTYENFIIDNTPINGETEVRRIFTKVINPLCQLRRLRGTKGGNFSKFVISYDELMYNRRNWRDITKRKDETRQEYEARAVDSVENSRLAYVNYIMQKVRRYHQGISEVRDEWANGEATQIHHIFPRSDYQNLAEYPENLIVLTPTQHMTKAHPSNNTHIVDRNYQLICLNSKWDSIQKSIELQDGMYSEEDFIFVTNNGLNKSINDEIIKSVLREEIRSSLNIE